MADYVIGVCVNGACDGGTLYRSIRPLEPTDKLDPALFIPVRENIPPPPAAGTADCPLCGRKVVWTYETKLTKQEGLHAGPVPSSSGPIIETLFQTEEGETIVNMAAAPDGWTVVWTNKRIVRLHI